MARYAERRSWEFPHELQKEPGGTLLLRGTVRGLVDIRKELITWGDAAEVIEPVELRAALLEQAQATMQASFHAGGNTVTARPEGHSCLPS